jgi:hypothetical protein
VSWYAIQDGGWKRFMHAGKLSKEFLLGVNFYMGINPFDIRKILIVEEGEELSTVYTIDKNNNRSIGKEFDDNEELWAYISKIGKGVNLKDIVFDKDYQYFEN